MEQEEKEAIKTRFGDINYKGLEQLKGMYDTYQMNESIDTIHEVIGSLQQLLDNLERLKAGACELIDDDIMIKDYDLEECGDISYFADEICSDLDICSDSIEKVSEQLAPLLRLLPTEDGQVYVDFKDTLGKEKDEDDDDDWGID